MNRQYSSYRSRSGEYHGMKRQKSRIREAQCCQEFIRKSWQEREKTKKPAGECLPGENKGMNYLRTLRAAPTTPSKPRPSNNNVVGSGTAVTVGGTVVGTTGGVVGIGVGIVPVNGT